jgi:hypothetical protein
MPRKLLPNGGYFYYGKLTHNQSRQAYKSMGGLVSRHQVDPDSLVESQETQKKQTLKKEN